MASVKPIPEGFEGITPYLAVEGAAGALDFYKDVFGATERMRMEGAPGTIAHAELQIGATVLMLSDAMPDMGIVGPKKLGGSPVTLMVYVEDVDKTYARALEKGATPIAPVEDQFYGDRSGQFEDPFGHRWNVGTHTEDISEEEMGKRAAEAVGGNQQT